MFKWTVKMFVMLGFFGVTHAQNETFGIEKHNLFQSPFSEIGMKLPLYIIF